MGRGPLEVCENGVQKKNRKRRKNPRHRSREAIFERHPKTTEKNDTGAHPPRAKFARAADTLRKIPFSKRARFCSPRGFLTFETQIRQKLEHRTVQNSNTRKKLSSRQVRKMKFFSKLHNGSKRHRDAKWLQNPLFCSVSRVVTSTDVFRAARVQNEFAPEKFLNRYEKRFEKREKGSEKRSETRLKNF